MRYTMITAVLLVLPLSRISADPLRAERLEPSRMDTSSDGTIRGLSRVADPGPTPNDPLEHPISITPHAPREPAAASPSPSSGAAFSTIVGGLAVCLGAFLLFVWATRRSAPASTRVLPSDVVELLGRTVLAPRQQLQLVRLGKKLVLLCVSPHGVEPLVEIDDPDEVTRLTGLCHQEKSNSVTATFREVLGQYGREPAPPGFLGNVRATDGELARTTQRRIARREDEHV